eukprot:UN24959
MHWKVWRVVYQMKKKLIWSMKNSNFIKQLIIGVHRKSFSTIFSDIEKCKERFQSWIFKGIYQEDL